MSTGYLRNVYGTCTGCRESKFNHTGMCLTHPTSSSYFCTGNRKLFARVVGFFGVLQYIFFIEQHLLENAFGVHFGLVVKVGRGRVAAFAAAKQRFGFYLFAKLNGAYKAVAIVAISFMGAFFI